MNKSQVLVLISTVLPGTTREYFINLIDNTKFIYNPYLIAMGSVKWDMVNPEMILIGTKDGNENGDAVELIKFYKTIIKNNPRYIICTWDECECIKIFYNTFVSTKIVLVNMIQDVANKIGNIDVDIVTKALADSKMRIMGPQYMTAGMGDGGACHPRDNIALRHMAKKLDLGYDLFSAIMQSREVQAENLAKFLIKVSNENNLEIYIHGKSYKPGVPYCDGSYSILVADFIQKNGLNVKFIDPLTEQHTPKDIKGVVLLAHSPSTTYKYMAHESDSNDKFYCNILEGSIVVDPWRKFYTEKFKVIHYGNSRENNNSN